MQGPRATLLVRPPDRPSSSAQTLRRCLGSHARLSRAPNVRSQYKYVINWGNSGHINAGGATVLNKPEAVCVAVDKLDAFRKLQGSAPIPKFRTKLDSISKGDIWFARTMLRASGGRGIVVLRKGDTIPDAPLYVRYIRKSREFRVHVVNGQVIFCQEKKKEREAEQTADQKLIRNYDNGWVFCLVNEEPPEGVKDAAVSAISGLGLDFGAVDIVVARDSSQPFVLEVNTAPGLSSPSLIKAYQEAFTSWLIDTSK